MPRLILEDGPYSGRTIKVRDEQPQVAELIFVNTSEQFPGELVYRERYPQAGDQEYRRIKPSNKHRVEIGATVPYAFVGSATGQD